MNAPNTTFDVYLAGSLPPAVPDISGLKGYLVDRWQRANRANEGDRVFFWTATLEVPLGANLPDLWPGAVSQTTIWAPDQNGDPYTVVFVERERRFRGNDFLRVYLVKGSVVAITVEEADGNPTLTGITTLIFDQADGFTVSQPAANQAQINLPRQMSIDLDAGGLKLKGDAATPGNSTYYGTDGSGTKGWYALPAGYTDEQAQDAVGNILTDTATIDFTYNDAANQITADVKKQMSITSDGSGLKLSGDAATPGNSMLYGTNGSGTKGWYAQPSGSTVSTANSVQGDGSSGNKIQLVNDTFAPGNNQVYGTNSSGTRGWSALPTATSGSSQLGSNHSITSTNGTFEDTGLSVTLPSAGTYLLLAGVHGTILFSAGSAGFITARLRNSSDSVDLPGTDTLVVEGSVASQGFQASGAIATIFTCAASKTIKLYAKRDSATTWSTSDVAADSNGGTSLSYVKLSN